MNAVVEEKEAFRASFESFSRTVAASDPAWLRPIREAAIARFAERGFPTTREEAWRFTGVAPIARTAFRRPEARGLGAAPCCDIGGGTEHEAAVRDSGGGR